MNILITGGAGFIGSHITDKLIARGHQVTILDNLSSGKKENLPPEANLTIMDIRDAEKVEQLFKDNSFDAVFHLAAQIDVRASVANPLQDAATNITASLNLIHQAALSGVKTFIFSSTGGAIYGDTQERPTPESHGEHPLSPYGIGKLTIDKYLAFYRNTYPQFRTVSLRYGNVYGPRQNPHGEAGVVAIFINKMMSGINPQINGDGNQTRDYVFVEDVAHANILALESATAFGTYNIGTGKESTVNELFSFLNTAFENAYEEMHAAAKTGEQQTSSLSSIRAQKELSWQPRTTLETGLQKTVEWFKNQR